MDLERGQATLPNCILLESSFALELERLMLCTLNSALDRNAVPTKDPIGAMNHYT